MKKSSSITSFLVLVLCIFGRSVSAAPIELSLDESIALAMRNNSNILIAKSDREKTLWAVKQAEANKGFTLSYTHTDERYDTPPSSSNGDRYTFTTKYDNNLSANLPVYSGEKLESQIDQAKLNLRISDLNLEATKQQLRQTVTTDYFNVLQYRNSLQISQETVDNYSSHLKNVQAQYEVGTVAKSDVLSSEVSLANAQDSLIKAENNYQLAGATLNNAIGMPLSSDLRLKEDLRYEKYPLTLEYCFDYALVNRPEMAQYQAKIASSQDDLKIAQSGYLPSANLSATQDWYDMEFPGSKNSNWSVGLTISLNVFDSGLTKSKVQQAKSGIVTTQELARQQRDSILLEVRQYFLGMREAEKRIETSKVAVNQAEENLKIAEARYSAGVGTNLDVLDAVLSLNTAKTNFVQALYDYNTNKAQLDRSMGVAAK